MQCSMLYSLLKSVYCADSTLKQETGSTHLVSFLCDALISYSSTGPAVRTVQLYISAIEVVCIAGLTIAVITNVMSKYEDLLIHATWNNQRTQLCKFDHPKYQMENTDQESNISEESDQGPALRTSKPGCIKAESK
jgi:hypothetical protein